METLKDDLEDYEQFVGIEEFSTNTPPIGGKIKKSIADFVVREITETGEILSTYEKKEPIRPFNPREHNYTLFTLIKKNTDTIHAAKILMKYLSVSRNDLTWAGIKDNTAITAQKFSVKGNYIQSLQNFSHKNITISDIRPSKKKMIALGSLWGNRFAINIRELLEPYDQMRSIVHKWTTQVNETGFPNYFGLQRFGQHRPNSHTLGKLIFQDNYKRACEEFLYKTYPREYESIKRFRKEAEKRKDYNWIIRNCPKGLSYEKMIFRQLQKDPENYKRAFFALPRSLVNLIMSSFQSYIFNKSVSFRMKKGDPIHRPIKGDIVAVLLEKKGNTSLIRYKYHGGDCWNDHIIEKAFNHERAAVLAPIVGHKTRLDTYSSFSHVLRELFEEENFELSDYKHKFSGLFTFRGTFRPINRKPVKTSFHEAHVVGNYPEEDPNGVHLEFSLTKGTYATMLLRELMKRSQIEKK